MTEKAERTIEIKWFQKTTNLALGVFFAFLFFLISASPAEAGNQQITFQGKLTNASGNTVNNGTYYLKLTIYDAASAGTCQYTASSTCSSVTSTPVTVTNGIFSINLGDTSASLAAISPTLFNNSALYLGVTVCSGAGAGCDSEMTPRKRITAAPYAFNADYLSGLATSTIGGVGSYVPVTDSSGNLKITNSLLVATTTAGQFGVGTTTVPTGIKTFIDSTTASDKLFVIRANISQTGNLQEWQNNAGTALVAVNSSGNISTSGTLATFGNATIGGHLYPSTDNLYDIGASSTQWRYGNFQGGILIANGSTTSTLLNNSLTLGQATNFNSGKFYVDSSGNVSASGSLQTYTNVTSTGIIYASGGLISSASSTFSNLLNIAGDVRASSTFQVTGNSILYSYLGVGTSPSYPLHVKTSSDNIFVASIENQSATGHGLEVRTLDTSAGRVGLEVYANGVSTFAVGNDGNTTLGVGGILTLANTSLASVSSTAANLRLAADGARQIQFWTNAGQRMYINSSGNTFASGTLQTTGSFLTYGNVTSTGNLYALSGTASTSILNGSSLTLGSGTNYGSGMFNIDSNGNVSASGTLVVFDRNNNGLVNISSAVISRISTDPAIPDTTGSVSDASVLSLGDYNDAPGGFLVLKSGGESGILFKNGSDNLVAAQLGISDDSGGFQIVFGSSGSPNPVTSTIDLSQFVLNRGVGFNKGRFYINPTTGDTSASGSLRAYGNVTSTGNLYALSGTASTSILNGSSLTLGSGTNYGSGMFNIDSNGNVSASGTLAVFGNTTLSGTLNVTSNTSSLRSLYLSGLTTAPNTQAGALYFNSSDAKFYGYTANGTAVDLSSTGGSNWSFTTNYGAQTLTPSSTIALWTKGSLFASSTMFIGATTASSTVVSSTSFILGKGANYANGIFAIDSNGIVSTSGTLNVAGGPDPIGSVWHPTHKSSITDTASYNLKGNYSVFVSGNYAYVASFQEDALTIIDVSNPASTTYRGSYTNATLLNGASSVFVSGNYAYVVAQTADTLAVIDISASNNPTLKGSLTDSTNLGSANSVFVSGNYAYVAASVGATSGYLAIIDISNPSNPILKGSISSGSGGAILTGAVSVFISGNYAYVAVGYGVATNNGLEIIDVSNPSNPVHAGQLFDSASTLLSRPRNVFVSGNYAYITSNSEDGLEIIDISNPASPAHKGSIANGAGGALLDSPWSIFVSGNYAYVGSQNSDAVEIVNISNPANPVHKGSIANGAGGASLTDPFGIFVSGNYAYVATYDNSTSGALEIIDVSGAVISNARIGALSVDTLQTTNFAQFDQNLSVRGGLNVSGPAQLLGEVSIGGGRATSTNMGGGGLTVFTNQTSSTLTSRVFDVSGSTGFILNSGTSTWTGSDRNLVSFQTNGTDKFLFAADGSMIVNKASGYNLGKFYVDSSGNTFASGSLKTFANVTSTGNLYALTGTASTSILNGSSLTLGSGTNYGSGMFNIDSNGNVSASGSLSIFAQRSSILASITSGNADLLVNETTAGIVANASVLSLGNTADTNGGFLELKGGNAGVVFNYGGKIVGQLLQNSTGLSLILGDGSATTTLSKNQLILARGANDNTGKFYVDNLGQVYASSTITSAVGFVTSGGVIATYFTDTYNTTLGDSDAADGDWTRVYGSLVMGTTPTGNAQIYLKASSTTAVPLLIQDSNGNIISKTASSSVEAIVSGAQTTLNGGSLLTLGDASGLPGSLSIRATADRDGGFIIYRNASAIGTQLTSSNLIMGDGSSTTTLSNTSLILNQMSGYNKGLAYIDNNGNVSVSGTMRIFGLSGSATTGGLQISATNSTTTLTSYATGAGAGAFVFNTNTMLAVASSSVLLSVRNNGSKVFSIDASGYVTATGTFQANNTNPGPGDVAEYVNLVAGETVEAGDVVMVDVNSLNQYRKSDMAYAQNVAGVISGSGAFLIGGGGANRAPLALAGLVKVKVIDENGPISVGDYLVSASKQGYAMKYDMANPPAGGAGLVGMALESLAKGEGKILILINKGLVSGQSGGSVALNVSVDGNGQLVNGNDLDMAGQSIFNLLSIKSKENKWMIDEDGYLIVKVKTKQGDKELYGLQSGQDKELVLSGSAQLENGLKKIELPLIDQEVIDPSAPIKVSVTLTGEAKGVFVSEKSYQGFTVKELGGGTSNATFDWLVIAKRRPVDYQEPTTAEPQPAPEIAVTSTVPEGNGADIASTSTVEIEESSVVSSIESIINEEQNNGAAVNENSPAPAEGL